MSAFLSASDQILLQMLTQASMLLAVLAVSIALSLVAWRYYEDRRKAKRNKRRAELEHIIWGVLNADIEASDEYVPALKCGDMMLICDLALDMLRPLRGESAMRLVRLLEMWPIRPYMRQNLKRGRREQRIRILTLLAHFDDAESLDLLKQWIAAKDFYVQLAALRSLAARDAVDALPDILKHLIHAERQNTSMLSDVLRRFGEPALDMLTQLAASAEQPEIKLAAITALEAIGSLEAVPVLIAIAADPIADIRAAAIAALGKLGDTRAEQAVLAALGDKDEAVRVRAAKAAGKLHLRAAAPVLAAMLSDASWWVRYRAAEALLAMGTIGQSFLQARSVETDRAGKIAAQVLAEQEAA